MSSSPRAVTRNPLLKGFIRFMPNGVKRLVLLSSLIAYVTNTSDPEREFIKHVNTALNLSRGPDSSLEFPVRLSKVFWGDRELFQHEIHILTSETASAEKERAALRIATMVPSWFAYGKPKDIAQDIAMYFNEHHQPQLT